MNVRFINVKLLETYLALETKDSAALYFIQDAQRLYQGEKLIGVGAEASKVAAGLLSAEDYSELQELIATVPTIEERLAAIEGGCEFTAEEKAQLASIQMLYATEEEVDNKITRAIEANGIVWEELELIDGEARIGNTYYATIQQAFAAAKPGDTINVSAGTYDFIEFTKATAANLTIVGGDGVYFKKVRFMDTTNYGAPDNLTLKNITFNGEGIAAVSGEVNNLSIINSAFVDGAVIHTNTECAINGLLIRNCNFAATNSTVNTKEKTAILMQSPAKNVVIIDNNIADSEHNAIQAVNAIGTLTIDGNTINNIGSRAMRIITKDGATLVIKDNVIENVNTNPAEAEENNGEIIKITGAVTDGALVGNTYDGQAISFVNGIGKVL